MGKVRLSREQRGFLALLGLPAFGLALSSAVVTTYLPVFIERLAGPAINGLLIGVEGVMALFVPFLIGSWSDSLRRRSGGGGLLCLRGGRLPFVLAGTALAAVALLAVPLGRDSLAMLALVLVAFFAGYFTYYAPYYALFPDLVPGALHGRSMGFQGVFRSVGLLLALVGGGLLLALWEPLPFLIAAVALAGVTAVFVVRGRVQLEGGVRDGGPETREVALSEHRRVIWSNPGIRRWAIANAMWEAAIAALKAFVVLYFTIGLGLSAVEVSGALALVAVAAVAAAPISGNLADRYGLRPVMLATLWVFGLGLLIPLFTTNTYFLIGILPVAFAAVALITLPYAVLMKLLPNNQHGAAAGLFGISRGVGVVLGPLLAGGAVVLLRPMGFFAFDETAGYAAMFLVASAFLLLSIPLLRKIDA